MSRPRVLLDVDGPLTLGFVEAACAALRDLGVDAQPERCTEWDIMRAFGVDAATEKAAYAALHRPGIAAAFEPRVGALEFVDFLRGWADVVAVTAPLGSPTWAHERDVWLRSQLGFAAKEIVHTSAKHLIAGDALVDDKCSNLRDWCAAWPRGLGVLWEEPYNASDLWPTRASTYADLRFRLEERLR